jgi:hypothetical protein
MVLVNGANLVFQTSAVRLLQDYSAMAALTGMILIFSVPANVLQSVITTYVGESLSNKASVASLTQAFSKFSFAVAAGILVAGAVFSRPTAAFLNVGNPLIVYVAFCSIALLFAVSAIRGILQGQQKFVLFSASLATEACGNLVFGLGFVLIFGGVRSAIVGNACAIGAALVFSLLSVRAALTTKASLEIDIRRIVVKSVGTMLALSALAAMSWLDVILVRHLVPHGFADTYAAMGIVGKIIIFSISFIPLVLVAKASKLASELRPTRALFLPMIGIGLAFCVIELALVRIFPLQILHLVGGQTAVPAAPYLPIYATAVTALALTTIVAYYGIGTHRFAFVIPLALVEVAEIVGIGLRHQTLAQVVLVVLIGHTSALVLTTITVALTGRSRRARVAMTKQDPLFRTP